MLNANRSLLLAYEPIEQAPRRLSPAATLASTILGARLLHVFSLRSTLLLRAGVLGVQQRLAPLCTVSGACREHGGIAYQLAQCFALLLLRDVGYLVFVGSDWTSCQHSFVVADWGAVQNLCMRTLWCSDSTEVFFTIFTMGETGWYSRFIDRLEAFFGVTLRAFADVDPGPCFGLRLDALFGGRPGRRLGGVGTLLVTRPLAVRLWPAASPSATGTHPHQRLQAMWR